MSVGEQCVYKHASGYKILLLPICVQLYTNFRVDEGMWVHVE